MRSARLSHLEIVVDSIPEVEPFYTSVLAFSVTDRSARSGDGSMVFLSQDPDEHHQLVLRQSTGSESRQPDHIAVRLHSSTTSATCWTRPRARESTRSKR